MKPLIIINLKTYETGTGKKAVKLAKISSKFDNIVLCPQPTDIKEISKYVETYAQHIEPVGFGSNTGSILPEAVKQAGAKGTLLNHSERRLNSGVLEKSIKRAKECGLKVILCVQTPSEAKRYALFNPDYIAYEPPELIGGDISVSTSKPEVITKVVMAVKSVNPKIKVLVGAGVKNREDVQKSLELGAVGVLLASGVTKARDPEKVIKDLVC